MTEQELEARFGTKSRLASGGDCAFVDQSAIDGMHAAWGHADVGTIVVSGNLRVRGELPITDRLHCFIVLGDLEADALRIRETEVYVGGDVITAEVDDRDAYLTVAGEVRTR